MKTTLAKPSTGSSPRARGTPFDFRHHAQDVRFIPAGAGNAGVANLNYVVHTVHPRGRGERPAIRMPTPAAVGSSPRARGTRAVRPDDDAFPRFIPAGAGNAICSPLRAWSTPVHPRGRGEREGVVGADRVHGGSSPRARGTQLRAEVEEVARRFIPAGAGNAGMLDPNWRASTVHPRGRGERCRCSCQNHPLAGSSPRARGTRLQVLPIRLFGRFIPAGAGNAPLACRALPSSPVHPRGRGERLAVPSMT